MFPDKDITDFRFMEKGVIPSRDKYPKQMQFFKASKDHSQILLMGPNGSGKSMGGGTMDAYHITGLYPTWWEGKKFTKPIRAWICGVEH